MITITNVWYYTRPDKSIDTMLLITWIDWYRVITYSNHTSDFITELKKINPTNEQVEIIELKIAMTKKQFEDTKKNYCFYDFKY